MELGYLIVFICVISKQLTTCFLFDVYLLENAPSYIGSLIQTLKTVNFFKILSRQALKQVIPYLCYSGFIHFYSTDVTRLLCELEHVVQTVKVSTTPFGMVMDLFFFTDTRRIKLISEATSLFGYRNIVADNDYYTSCVNDHHALLLFTGTME